MNQKSIIVCLGLLFPLIVFKQSSKVEFICPPSSQTHVLKQFDGSGYCSVCEMKLVEKGTCNKSLTKNQIEQDIDILITTLKSNHPGIYDYHDEQYFDSLILDFKQEYSTDLNILGEYKIVSKIIASIGDAHTYAMNPIDHNILEERMLFPIVPTVNNNQITIDDQPVESINEHPEDEILKTLQSFSNSDGNALPYKNAFIEMEFPLRYFTFIDTSSTFKVKLRNGEVKNLKGKSYFKTGLRPKPAEPSFIIDGSKAVLKIPSWEDEMASSFKNDLKEMAETTKLGQFIKVSMEKTISSSVEHLVIDLTGNLGGRSGPAAILLTYLIDSPFKYYSELKIASDKFPTKAFITNEDLVDFYESDEAKSLIYEKDGEFYFNDEILSSVQPNPNQYSGTVELLVDKYSLSVSTDVVAILKNNREIQITGDEIGGSLEHYCAGNFINLKLPNSGIEVNIPLQRIKY